MDPTAPLTTQVKGIELRLDQECGAILLRHPTPPWSAWTSRIPAGWLACWPSPSRASCRSGSAGSAQGRAVPPQGHQETSDAPVAGPDRTVLGLLPAAGRQRLKEETLALLRQAEREYGGPTTSPHAESPKRLLHVPISSLVSGACSPFGAGAIFAANLPIPCSDHAGPCSREKLQASFALAGSPGRLDTSPGAGQGGSDLQHL